MPWSPLRAFDDRSHVYLEMPAGMKSSDAPALLIAAGGGTQMVNYRVRGSYFVVDRLFEKGVLLAGVGRAAGPRGNRVRGRSEVRAMADHDIEKDPQPAAELADEEQEHGGGGRFNRRLLMMVSAFAVVVGVVAVEGIRSAGVKTTSVGTQQPADDGADAARDKAEVEELAAGGRRPQAAPSPAVPAPVMINSEQAADPG